MLNKITPRPYLAQMVKIKVVRGSTSIFYAYKYEEEWNELQVLSKKQQTLIHDDFSFKLEEIEIDIKKKAAIATLFPLIPTVFHKFWIETKYRDS
jgi:hypothetical protein